MTATQWRKIELRLRHLLRERGLVNIILVEDLDGTIRLQVVGGKAEVIKAASD